MLVMLMHGYLGCGGYELVKYRVRPGSTDTRYSRCIKVVLKVVDVHVQIR